MFITAIVWGESGKKADTSEGYGMLGQDSGGIKCLQNGEYGSVLQEPATYLIPRDPSPVQTEYWRLLLHLETTWT